jgi:hypothetical protein
LRFFWVRAWEISFRGVHCNVGTHASGRVQLMSARTRVHRCNEHELWEKGARHLWPRDGDRLIWNRSMRPPTFIPGDADQHSGLMLIAIPARSQSVLSVSRHGYGP